MWYTVMWVVRCYRRAALTISLFPPGSLSAYFTAPVFGGGRRNKTLPWTWPGTPEEVWEQAQAVAVPFRPMLDRVPKQHGGKIDKEVLPGDRTYVHGENINFGVSVVLASGKQVKSIELP